MIVFFIQSISLCLLIRELRSLTLNYECARTMEHDKRPKLNILFRIRSQDVLNNIEMLFSEVVAENFPNLKKKIIQVGK